MTGPRPDPAERGRAAARTLGGWIVLGAIFAVGFVSGVACIVLAVL